jgi:hypothetical protein
MNINLAYIRHRWQPFPIIIAVGKTVCDLAILEAICNWSYIYYISSMKIEILNGLEIVEIF